MKLTSTTIFALLLVASNTATATITTEYLAANGLNFTCSILQHTSAADPNAPVKQVMFNHGFPMFRKWWTPLLQRWDEQLQARDESCALNSTIKPVSIHAVACDLRGYTPEASPDSIDDYSYPIFASDTFALAKAAGFNDDGFHLIGHDHGAGLAWFTAGHDPNNQILSLTTLSVPHIDLVSDVLCGDKADERQVIVSNYLHIFTLEDSATRNDAALTKLFEMGLGPLDTTQFQKMLWWYNGKQGKYVSTPAYVSDAEVDAWADRLTPEAVMVIKMFRATIPVDEKPCDPVPEENRLGPITIPTLFICGLNDPALQCNNPWAHDYSPDLLPNFEHANFECGHDFFLEGNCKDMDESWAVMDKIGAFIFDN